MKDIADRISEVVVESMAAQRTEVEMVFEQVRSDIDWLQRALNTLPGTGRQADAKRAPSANGRRRQRNTQAVEKAESSQAAPSKTSTKSRRRERTPAERAEISKRMTAYWQRKREEKTASGK